MFQYNPRDLEKDAVMVERHGLEAALKNTN